MDAETSMPPHTLGTWVPLTSPQEAWMVSEADLLSISGLSELGLPGMVAYLGRALGGLVLDEAWISSSPPEHGHTRSPTSCSTGESTKWTTIGPEEA